MTDQQGIASPTRAEVVEAASELYRPDGLAIWMRSPNPMLDGRSPDELVEAGEGERVLDLICALCEGVVF